MGSQTQIDFKTGRIIVSVLCFPLIRPSRLRTVPLSFQYAKKPKEGLLAVYRPSRVNIPKKIKKIKINGNFSGNPQSGSSYPLFPDRIEI